MGQRNFIQVGEIHKLKVLWTKHFKQQKGKVGSALHKSMALYMMQDDQ